MRPKSLILLALALGCGLIASIGISQVMKARKGQSGPPGETQAILVALIDVISVYGASILFLGYTVRRIGRHGWPVTLAVCLGVPVGVFLLFEKFLIIPLPKGYAEPIFYLLY